MPTPRVLMSKIRRTLQLLADSGLSTRQVAASLSISKTTVSEIALYARDAGVDWPLASPLSDDELQARLYPPPRPRSTHRREPDYLALHQELKRPGVTLQLLWEEYRADAAELIVLDDLAIAPIAAQERQDLLELLDDRVGSRSTLITSQLPTSAWHQWLNEPTIADAIMDRLLHGSHTIALKGESQRRAKAQA